MGTQFWWFYDVLAVAMTFGICYAVIVKGFNKVVFQLAAFAIAIVVGILGANFLAPKVYDELFSEKLHTSVQHLLTDEDFDLYELVSENLVLSASEDDKEEPPDAQQLRQMYQDARTDADLEDWYYQSFGAVYAQQLDRIQKFHPMTEPADLSWRLVWEKAA
jgi:nicotinamide riboside kinase